MAFTYMLVLAVWKNKNFYKFHKREKTFVLRIVIPCVDRLDEDKK